MSGQSIQISKNLDRGQAVVFCLDIFPLCLSFFLVSGLWDPELGLVFFLLLFSCILGSRLYNCSCSLVWSFSMEINLTKKDDHVESCILKYHCRFLIIYGVLG